MAGEESYVVETTLGNPMPGRFVVSWFYESPGGRKPFTNKEVNKDLLKNIKLPKKGLLSVKLRIKVAGHQILRIWPASQEEPVEKDEFKIGSRAESSKPKAELSEYERRFAESDARFRIDDQDSTAPYNFVQMAPQVMAASSWQTGEGPKLSGRVELKLEAKTPLLVAGHSRREDRRDTRRFFQVGNTPVIPGSTMKGMLRNVFEIVTASALRPVSQKHIHYRDVSDTNYYQKVMVEQLTRPNGARAHASKSQAGFLVAKGKSYEVIPCSVSKIACSRIFTHFNLDRRDQIRWLEGEKVEGKFVTLKAGDKYERVTARHKNELKSLRQRFVVSAEQDWSASKDGASGKKGAENFLFHYSKALFLDKNGDVPEADRKQRQDFNSPTVVDGWLVFSGWMKGKYTEFVFHAPQGKLKKPLSRDVWRVFDAQITPAQRSHLAKLQELAQGDLYPQHGIPVFYLQDDRGEISDIGLTQLFRLRARHRPASLTAVDRKFFDLATDVFGSTSKAGRVSFCHAPCVSGQNDREYNTVLGQPHASSAAHYLVPSSEDEFKQGRTNAGGRKNDANVLAGWNAPDTMMRGWKRYWHRPGATVDAPPNNNRDTQVNLQPLRAGATFTTTIEFRDLSPVELGALLFALNPGSDPAKPAVHKLGMGKALGWGSVEFAITGFEAWEPATRYRSLLGRFGAPAPACTAEQARAAFIAKLNELFPKSQPHIDDLRQMLDFERAQRTDWSHKTRPLTLPEFKPKALLQSVSEVYKGG